MYLEYLPDALLATSTIERYNAYRLGLNAGFLTIDEVRRKEDLPALPELVPTVARPRRSLSSATWRVCA